MAVGQQTIWERFLKQIIRPLIDEDKLREFHQNTDWETVEANFSNPNLDYPDYYKSQNFHGVEKGYLNPGASVSYDPITQYVLPPNETWIRQGVIEAIAGQPRRILDLGCGTGSTTVLLKQAFPDAEVIGLDLSPYMLFMGDRKAQQQGLEIKWVHGNAEATDLEEASFEVVTASLLFHETPPAVSKAILREAFRLLKPGGQVIILDGNQKTLRQVNWLSEIFEEPYIKDYATDSVEAWLGAANFEAVQTKDWWWLNQITTGIKPTPVVVHYSQSTTTSENEIQGMTAPAF
ncbi:class I SAM-dependent methyltransferase [Oscillatoria salina]|uniref:class I SAM-dependent methyltransferase n=1 Tax=Oscillatoria salina TaxID=331517 RepID=UPI0013B6E35D|nr:class I SAM-dependent methyltransferase [Oscillatoria salina]MBZ8182125.1 class I SAM-dependent methyltransferase [Oscillatoria salina IIICB1]NET87779.1 class I SAM-dependent methyltransferase [Kamptonema sp. SIO1D9]